MTLASSFPLLLDLFLKSAAILLLAGVAASVWRRASAANRHMIWLAALLVLLLLPLTKLADPQWIYVWAPNAQRVSAAPAVVTRVASPISISTAATDVAPPSARTSVTVNWAAVGMLTWLAGMGVVLLHRAGVRWRLARLAARSHPIAAERWLGLVEDWPAGVEIRESTECRVPLAAGVWRPIVLLPTAALDWSEARLTAALRHEFGHICRRDCLSRLLLDLACAIYWMNPLIWAAARSMRVAQEQSCDDLVLRSGASAADYATQLVDVVRALGTERFTARHALAMAQPSTLETRVRAIVDADRDRRTLSGTTMTCGVLGAALTLTLCSIAQLQGAEKKAQPKSEGADADVLQIKVETKFFQIASDASDAFSALPGMKDFASNKAGIPTVVRVFTKEQEATLLKALRPTKGVDLLSAPSVTTRSGQHATIEIEREFRYPTDWKKDPKTGGLEPKAYETKYVGVTFGILADVKKEGSLALMLEPKVVEFMGFRDLDAPGKPMTSVPDPAKPLADPTITAGSGKSLPAGHRGEAVFSTHKMNTEVTVWPGQSVLLELGAAEGAAAPKRRLFVLASAEVLKPQVEASAVTITADTITVGKATGAVTASDDVKVETANATILAQNAEVQPKKATPAPAKLSAMEKAEKIILPKIEFVDATVTEAVTFLTAKSRALDPEKTGVNIVLKLPEGDTTKLSLSLEDIPLSEALKYLTGLANLKIGTTPDAILLQPVEGQAALAEPAAGTPEAALLKRARSIVLPSVEFKDATVTECVDFLRAKSRDLDPQKKSVNILVMPSKTSGDVKITLNLTNVSVVDVLNYVAELSGLKLEVNASAFALHPRAE